MMRTCNVRAMLRSAAAALLLATSVLLAPLQSPDAQAAPAEVNVAPPTGGYLDQLLHEINSRRAQVGVPPLAYATPGANSAVGQYLADLTPWMQATQVCTHGMYNPVAPGWDYVTATGLEAEVRGEVIGCPMDGFHWSPRQIADSWWSSPAHFQYVYGDPEANIVACGAYGPGRKGFETVACVTLRI